MLYQVLLQSLHRDVPSPTTYSNYLLTPAAYLSTPTEREEEHRVL